MNKEEIRKKFTERTFVMLKPDAVERHLIGEIIQRFERAGLEIIAIKMVRPNAEILAQHYAEIKEKHGEHVFNALVDWIREKRVVVMVLEGINAVRAVRKLLGESWDPMKCSPGTIRGDYTTVDVKYADAMNEPIMNLVHASDSIETATREIRLWFPELQI
ncbi:MAG: nucleoside-diphosphate kinase [Candidatus Korarchaeota archaeon]